MLSFLISAMLKCFCCACEVPSNITCTLRLRKTTSKENTQRLFNHNVIPVRQILRFWTGICSWRVHNWCSLVLPPTLASILVLALAFRFAINMSDELRGMWSLSITNIAKKLLVIICEAQTTTLTPLGHVIIKAFATRAGCRSTICLLLLSTICLLLLKAN